MRKGIDIDFLETEGVFRLSGILDAHIDITLLEQAAVSHLVLNLKEIKETNSVGIKKWVEGLQALQSQGKTLEYQECSPAFVRQCNFVPEIHQAVRIHSFEVIFECEECDEFENTMLATQDLDLQDLPPDVPCPSCGDSMEPEDVLVFEFLNR